MQQEITGAEIDTLEAMLNEVKIKAIIKPLRQVFIETVKEKEKYTSCTCTIKTQQVIIARSIIESLYYKVILSYRPSTNQTTLIIY